MKLVSTDVRKSYICCETGKKPTRGLVHQLQYPLQEHGGRKHLEDIYTTSTNAIRRPLKILISFEIEVITSQVHACQQTIMITGQPLWERLTALQAK